MSLVVTFKVMCISRCLPCFVVRGMIDRRNKMSNEKLYINGNLCSVVTFAIIIRWSVSLYPYSGQNTPPLYGDYEAQRHWMEVTVNLPPGEWYFNTSKNNLMYWGLDYPPVTAYHSYLNGKIAQLVDPAFVELLSSRGYESYYHKLFMRSTVVVSDVLVYFSSIITFFYCVNHNRQKNFELKHGEVAETKQKSTFKSFDTCVSYLAQVAIALLYPGLILIDHGHFQYNSISLGFTTAAITALIYDRFYMSSFFFCLALNYKQMSLYHSLPFFIYMLSHCYPGKDGPNVFSCCVRLFCISITVIITFGFIWYPFASYSAALQLVSRLFPLSRGIFEDKVSNIWCAVNVVFKINKHFNQIQMAKVCAACVIMSSSASLLNLFKKPTIINLLLSLINVSLSFFLFSYQVHEKSILLVALPILLFFPFDPFPCFWFLIISNFSMFPLLLKDNLLIPFFSLSILFVLFIFSNVNFDKHSDKKSNKASNKQFSKKNIRSIANSLFILSIFGCVIIFLCSVCIKPPARYPDIWPLLTSVYSCLHFCLFFLYFNYVQIFKSSD